jgi:phosphoribosylaminoimidazolecarboxamide formyltransferase/IMP cyclohydrolase
LIRNPDVTYEPTCLRERVGFFCLLAGWEAMAERKIKRALIAVYDKTGIIEFARALVDEFGIEVISTGGTAKHLKDAGIPVTIVEQVTGFPEMLDGRVKTLHPKIHAAILADRDNPEHMRQLAEQQIEPIDMVVVNLYPFEKTVADPNCTFEQAIEMIDIGGPCLLRAAAKNHKHVFAVQHAWDHRRILRFLRGEGNREELELRTWFMTKVFQNTASYEIKIHDHFGRRYWKTPFLPAMFLDMSMDTPTPQSELRYGENPHQRGSVYSVSSMRGGIFERSEDRTSFPSNEHQMSFNNYSDADSAFMLCEEVSRSGIIARPSPTAVFIKHTNACGVGIASDPVQAYRRAYLGNPNAAMGGILAVNFELDVKFADVLMDTFDSMGKAAGAGGFFVEVLIAPSIHQQAGEIIQSRKKWGESVRLLSIGDMSPPNEEGLEYKQLAGGMLVQTPDLLGLNEDQWKVVTKRQPTDLELADLRLAWLIAKHTKSNAISICKDGMLIGNGAGQMSRVMSCRIATWLAKENRHEDKLKGSAAASDAFFPFRDGPDILMDAGVSAIIQPGGSKRDEDTIKACDERDVAMIFTGTRHFKH